jgi:hypothetical protein
MAVRQTIRQKPRGRPKARHGVRALTRQQVELFDTVRIKRSLEGLPRKTKAAVVEVLTVPRLGYHLEVVITKGKDRGKTAGLILGVSPVGVELVCKADGSKP